jgi:type II secretory pathway pseudopilin PulG
MRRLPAQLPVSAGNTGGRGAARVRYSGVTLIELVVVVLLLGIMLIMVVITGALFVRDNEQLKQEARRLAGTLESVRTLSILNGKTYTLQYNLDFDNQGYFVWIPAEPDAIGSGSLYEETDEGYRVAASFTQMPTRHRADRSLFYAVWIDRIAFGDGSETTDDEVRIEFRPRGGSHWHYVYLTNNNGDFYTVEVNPFTGVADIYPGELQPDPPEVLR